MLRFERDGRALKGVPAVVRADHPGELADLRSLVRDVGTSLAGERGRIESLLSADRVWSAADWAARYLDQPVTGCFGRRLIWQTEVGPGRWVTGWPHREPSGWTLLTREGTVLPVGRVRLWHPLRAGADEVGAWRDRTMAGDLRQPLRQAFREVYRVTPAEKATRFHSDRFAGHILRYRQANATMRTRGWATTYLGPWDGGFEGEAVREFGAWRARFFHALVEDPDEHDHGTRYCVTDRVRFDRRDGTVWQPVPVTGVPPLVFSEAMRDVAGFVEVASIATDPQWRDRGTARFRSYWAEETTGPLTTSAEIRRDVLSRLLPRSGIADRVVLGPRFLRVRGSRGAYRIHLGSGVVRTDPDDTYLPVAVDRRPPVPPLPFEDAVLTEVLSRAFLLLADDGITGGTDLRRVTG
ncbi:DUF4132 domain-containing protein [Micromonospora echinofusca]|uniref:DUF4132 domain-containing protein n=1 Tax=Micromonospora echinofusca TaxID=47858 RepID=UPI0027DCBF8E|nr:DUF4132 domain-containing protein [Micromonospora echinofusca]